MKTLPINKDKKELNDGESAIVTGYGKQEDSK